MSGGLNIDLSAINPSCGTAGETRYNFTISDTLAPGAYGQIWIT
jgi:hypothetical protein